MDIESVRREIRAVVNEMNPEVSISCPLLDLVEGVLKLAPQYPLEERALLVERLVLYSKAPPFMLHIKQLLSFTHPPSVGDEFSSESSKYDTEKFVLFFDDPDYVDPREYVIDDGKAQKMPAIEGILRDALVEAGDNLEKQFGGLTPSPKELLMQRLVTTAPMEDDSAHPLDQPSHDYALTKAVDVALDKFQQCSNSSGLSLMELLSAAIDEAPASFSTKMVLAERLIFACLPHPEPSAGADVLVRCFVNAIFRMRREELGVDGWEVDAVIEAIGRLPIKSSEVMILLKRAAAYHYRRYQIPPQAEMSMKMKFKVIDNLRPVSARATTSEIGQKSGVSNTLGKIMAFFRR